MTKAHRKRYLPVGDLVEQHPARALRVLLEHAPQQGLLNCAKLSPSRKGWTGLFSKDILASGELHDFILLHSYVRMKSAHLPLGVKVHFYSQLNQRNRDRISNRVESAS